MQNTQDAENDYSNRIVKRNRPRNKKFIEVSAVKFGIMGPEEMEAQSVVEVEFQETFDPSSNKPKVGGLMDSRLGPTNPYTKCQTCNEKMYKCM